MSSTFDRIKKLTVDHLGVDEHKVTPEANFVDQLGADSLDMVELVMAHEEEFGVEISDAQAESVVTVKDAVDLVDRLGAEAAR